MALENGCFSHLVDARVLMDCRYLGESGIGRATELLLRSMASNPPPGHWTLLTTRPLAPSKGLSWPGAEVKIARHNSTKGLGRLRFRIPECDVVVFPSTVRPFLWPFLAPSSSRRSVQVIHDLIPVDLAQKPFKKLALRLYFKSIARNSTIVATVSEPTRRDLANRLHLNPDSVSVFDWPIEVEKANALRERRQNTATDGSLLFVGRFAEHKNLELLVEAFAQSGWSSGPLRFVGQTEPGLESRVRALALRLKADLRIEGRVDDDALEQFYAQCRAVVLPSIFEGFGLPIQEAAAAGIPVFASSSSPVVELLASPRAVFDPYRVEDMAASMASISEIENKPITHESFWARTPDRLRLQLLQACEHALLKAS